MDTLFQDIKFGARMLTKNPMVTVVAVLTLALGIGANTAIFSTLNGFILRPLPVANADRLVVLGAHQEGTGEFSEFSYADFNDIRSQGGAFSDVVGYDLSIVGVDAERKVEPAVVDFVSGNFFQALGLKPEAGRLIYGLDTEKPGTEPVVVLGYDYWKKRFNSHPAIVGQQIKLNGHSATVAGIAPKGFSGLYSIVDMDLYLPFGTRNLFSTDSSKDIWTRRDAHNLRVVAALKPGVSLKQAQSSIDVLSKQLAEQYPDTHRAVSLRVYPEKLARPEPDPSNGLVIVSVLFMVLSGLVLLLACTNVANIVLVRATGREREMAVRAALGAAKVRLVRQLLTESLLLAALGGAAGVAAGAWASNLLASVHMEIATIPIQFNFSFDWRVFSFAFLMALMTGLIVGLAPAWRVARADLNKVLHEGSRGVLAGTTRSRMRSALVTAQVAGSLMLLVVAGLFIRSARNAERTYLGFDPAHVLNLTMDTRSIGFDLPRNRQFVRDLEDRVRALPGVESVSFASSVPMGYSNSASSVYFEGRTASSKEAAPIVLYNAVDPGYFTVMKVPLLRGRGFNQQDNENSPNVAVINEEMARHFWPKEDPIGKRFSMKGPAGPFIEIVGISKQGKYQNPVEDPQPFFYIPQLQGEATFGTLQVRTPGAPESLIHDVEREVHALAPDLPLLDVQSMQESLEGVNGFFLIRMGTRLTGVLGMIGLVLALVGVYGVISYVAAQRTHEIGVRMALGADRLDILKMVLRQGCMLVGGGVVAGLVLTFLAARAISSLMVGISATDPLTLAAVSLFLAAVGLLASFIPARRAMNVEPLKALKYE